MATPRSIIVEGNTITPDPADYDGFVGELQSEGISFEIATPVVDIPVSGGAQISGLDPAQFEADVAMEEEIAFEGLSPTEQQASPEKLARDVRRIANKELNKRPNMFMTPQSSPLGSDTYAHYEPSVEEAMAAADNDVDREDIDSRGKDSLAYKAYADQKWRPIHDVHQKHGLPVIRVAHMDQKFADDPEAAAAGAIAGAAGPVMGLVHGFDLMSALGLGTQVMGKAQENQASPAEQELVRMGVIAPSAERLEAIADEHLGLEMLGGLGGMFLGPGGVPMAIERAAVGMAGKVAGKAGGAVGQLVAGGTAGGLAAAGEEAVKLPFEAARGEEMGLGRAVEAAEEVGSGVAGGMAVGGVAAGLGAVGKKFTEKLRAPTTAGGDELATMEALSGERGTAAMGTGGYWPGKSVADAHKRVAKERAAAAGKEGPGYAASVDDTLAGLSKRVEKEVDFQEKMLTRSFRKEAEKYYASPEGKEFVPTHAMQIKLQQLLDERQSPGGIDLPFQVEIPDIKRWKKVFDEAPFMDAKMLDASLQGLDNLVYDNKGVASSSRVLRDLSRSMREVRDQFQGNAHTPPGPKGWSALKTKQSNKKQAQDNSRDALDLLYAPAQTRDLPSQQKRAVSALMKLGPNAGTAPAWEILKNNPELLKSIKRMVANEPFMELSGGTTRVPVSQAGIARAAVDPRTYTRFDPIAALLSDGMAGRAGAYGQLSTDIGSGSEKAMAVMADLEEEKEAMMKLIQAVRDRPADEEERGR